MKPDRRYVRTKARKIAAERGRPAAAQWFADKVKSTGETAGPAAELLDSGLLDDWREHAVAPGRDEYNNVRATWAQKWHAIADALARKHLRGQLSWHAIASRFILPAIEAELVRWRDESRSTRTSAKVPRIDTICAYLTRQSLRKPR